MSRKIHVLVETEPLFGGESWSLVINHNQTAHRQWLGRHCAWAFRNNHKVTTSPTDEEPSLDDRDWDDLKAAEQAENEENLPGHEQSRRRATEIWKS